MTEAQSQSALQRVWSQLQGLILTTLAVLVIVTALVVGTGRLLIPYADAIRPWLERTMSERIGQTIVLDRVEAQWPRLTPSLSLIGVQLDDGQGNRLEIDQARLEVHLPHLLDRRANLVRLVLLGLELVLGPDEQGRWGAELAAGAALTGSNGDGSADTRPPAQLLLGDLLIREAQVRVRVPGWSELLLHLDEGGVQRRGGQTLFYGGLALAPGAEEQVDLRLILDHPQGSWSGARGWLGIRDLALESWLPPVDEPAGAGSMSMALWLDWSEADARLRIDGEFDVQPLAARDPVSGRFLIQREAQGWQFELPELRSAENVVVRDLAVARTGAVVAMAVEALDLAGVHAELDPWLSAWSWWPRQLAGHISRLELGLDERLSLHVAEGHIEQLAFEFDDPLPSLRGLDLRLGLVDDRLLLEPSGAVDVRWRRVVRGDVALNAISGQVLLAPDSLELRGLAIDSAMAAARADGWIYLQRPRPFLDFVIEAERVGPMDPRPYLAHRNIPPVAMEWLDQALVRVEHASGFVNFHMRAGTLARDLRAGSYQAIVDFHGVDLDYWPGWPAARDLSGRAEFIGPRLSGSLDSAQLGEIRLSAPALEIADLTEPELIMALAAERIDAGDLAGTLAGIPVEGWASVLEPMIWSGPVSAQTRLKLPFRRMADWQIEGDMTLHHADLHLPAVGLGLPGLSGSLSYDREGIVPAAVAFAPAGEPVMIDLAASFRQPASLDLSARLNPMDLFLDERLDRRLHDAVSGRSDWRYRLEGGHGDGLRMLLDGDLSGLALELPAPLAKTAAQRWPGRAELRLSDEEAALIFGIEGLAVGRLAMATEGWGLDLRFGEPRPPGSAERGLHISGRLEELALGEWLALLGTDAGQTGDSWLPEALSVDLALDALTLPGLSASDVRLVSRLEDEIWFTEADSPELAGVLSVPVRPDSGRAIVADFQRVHLQRAEPDASAVEPDPVPRTPSGFSPLGLPPLSAVIEDLRWGELVLGRLRVEAHPAASGLEFELMEVSGSDLRLQGRGRWLQQDTLPLAQFAGRLSTPRLSALLRSAGYDAGIEASRTQIDLDVEWPGAPWDFALSRLVGSLALGMIDGQIPEARPGAGRLLGLVSFTAIPRRLMLDFRDVFSPGMRFDEIAGQFDLSGGFAVTDGLVMQSTSAVITITGATDMVNRQYDQEIIVEPGLGATLPVIGVLAGGPVGAAAGLVLRQLLERPLRGVAEVRYRISGPWDAPDIELVAARAADEEALSSGDETTEARTDRSDP